MGQFASRAFDGDPYIDIMRALPDKELVWWVQKVIWLAEGFTMLEHFGRTYPEIFMHKCIHCNGAGVVTCPMCNGYKVRRAHKHALQLPESSKVGGIAAQQDLVECAHCGDYCPWDQESEWEKDWHTWQRRLSYYDRTYGDLFNEWYEDVINEGRLDEDTQPEDEPEPGPNDKTLSADISKQAMKQKTRIKALMARIGGHPYEHSHVMPYPVIDPHASLAENLENMGYQNFDLPPELHPEKFPELLLEGPNGVLQKFDKEIHAEYLIMNNLEAALRDEAKPAMFLPSAGTVECPECGGQAWSYEWVPNFFRLLKQEPPLWARTFARMTPYLTYNTTPGMPGYSPHMAAYAAKRAEENAMAGAMVGAGGRVGGLGEVPSQPPVLSDKEVREADELLRPGPIPEPDPRLVNRLGARRLDGGIDWGRLISASAVEPPGASESAASDDTPVSTGKGRKGGKLVLAS